MAGTLSTLCYLQKGTKVHKSTPKMSALGTHKLASKLALVFLKQIDLLFLCRPDADPWRVQFFQCGYVGVSGWGGWRALVTTQAGSQAWVDLPASGPDAFLQDYAKGGEVLEQRIDQVAERPCVEGGVGL